MADKSTYSNRSSGSDRSNYSDGTDYSDNERSDKEDEFNGDEVSKFGTGMRRFTNKIITGTKNIPSNFDKWLNSK
jgi:hypothetical protein